MSTILNALQKQDGKPLYAAHNLCSHNPYQVTLLFALFVIIILLCALLILLLRPLTGRQVEAISPVVPVVQEIAVGSYAENKPSLKQVSRISFPTIPLSGAIDKTSAKPEMVVPAAKETFPVETAEEQPQIALSAALQEEDIDYSSVSQALQNRFQQALLMSKDEAKSFIENHNDDGSSLYQMARDFQRQVPAFSYDFHVYSSIADERWIRINDEDLVEGQFEHSGKVQVVEIQPNRTIFRMGNQSFSLQSLTDWRGL
jgi:general secretion pathway protein B